MKRLPPEELETEHVNKVYDVIAPHFDHTRYKPWPGVANFVKSLPPNSILVDVGCGNGRNLCIDPKIYDMGTDFSMPLCKIASNRKKPVFCASALQLPIRDGVFDSVICIAVIHHFASADRRTQCLREIARILRPGGTAFVTAWATDQPRKKKYDEQDQMIPWNLDKRFADNPAKYERFYHFFVKGEFAELSKDIPSLELKSESWEEGNWEVIYVKK